MADERSSLETLDFEVFKIYSESTFKCISLAYLSCEWVVITVVENQLENNAH